MYHTWLGHRVIFIFSYPRSSLAHPCWPVDTIKEATATLGKAWKNAKQCVLHFHSPWGFDPSLLILFSHTCRACKTLSSLCNPWLWCEGRCAVSRLPDSCISSMLTAVSQRSGFPSFWLRAWFWQELIMLSGTSVFYQRYDSSSSLLAKNCQPSIPWTPK